MKITDLVAIVAILIGVFCLALWIFSVFVRAVGIFIKHWRFRGAFRQAILHSQPSWTQVCAIADDYGFSKSVAYGTAKQFLVEISVGGDKKGGLNKHRQLIEGYVQSFEYDEPFDGISDDTRLTLEQLRKNLGTNAAILIPLANHLRELTAINDVSNRRQRFYTLGGFVVGVLGLVYGVVVSVYPLESAGHDAAAPPLGHSENR